MRRIYADVMSRITDPGVRHNFATLATLADAMRSERRDGETAEQHERRDAESMLFASRQLEQVLARAYEEPFPELRAVADLLPFNTEIKQGARKFIYYVYSRTGVARFSAAYTDKTAPRASLKGAEVEGYVQNLEHGYGWEADDLAAAAFAGEPIEPKLAIADRWAHDKAAHDTILWGVPELKLPGFLTHPNILWDDAPTGSWSTATVDQIIGDCRFLVNSIAITTLGQRTATDVLLPLEQMTQIRTQRMGAGDGTLTIYQFLQVAFPGVTWSVLNECAADLSDGHSDVDFAVAYCKRPEYVSAVRPMPYKAWPTQQQGLSFLVPSQSSVGGVMMPEPLTVHRMDGI